MTAKKGSILIVVLFFMVVLSIQMGAISFLTKQSQQLSFREKDSFERVLKAKKLIHEALSLIANGSTSVFPESLSDEASKINLNFASKKLLKSFFEMLIEEKGLPWDALDDYLDNLVTSRDENLLLSLDEAFLIPGMTSRVRDSLLPYVTVYTSDSKINPVTASPVVLNAVLACIPGDELLKKEIIEKLDQKREESKRTGKSFFENDKQLDPVLFLSQLALDAAVERAAFVSQLISFFTVETSVYHQELSNRREIIFRHLGGKHFEILFSYGI